MPDITLPDGSVRHFDHPVTLAEIARAIGPGLARAAVAGEVDGRLVDLDHVVDRDARVSLITPEDPRGLEVLRHSTAHLLAQAVKQLFPDAQVTIGPVIEDGFYYDFAYPRGFTPEDLERIETRMRELVEADLPVRRKELPRDEAIALFRDMGEEYKARIIESIPPEETLSVYEQGDFIDLCRGPHVPSTGRLGAFKLTKLSGAYWRGDPRNEMLQRVYGTAWPDKKRLKAYLQRLEEAEKRDHRRIGRQMDLFSIQETAPGMVFWHPRGWALYRSLEDYVRRLQREHGYQEVRTPMIVDRSLWERSGHWEKFRDNMFTTQTDNRDYAIKPMNCPCHILIFKQGLKSYRDLPLRLAEFGACHRNEPSGTLHGLMRIRGFVQDDAHIFCSEAQIESEVSGFIDMVYRAYRDFGFDTVHVALSTRPEQRVGEDALWDRAEAALEACLRNKGLDYVLQPGEGAFYGPKIEFALQDCLGRRWQCGTVQLDFSMPGRLGAEYVAEDGSRRTPVMIHRAVLGSLERFIGVLLEHYAGRLPLWLAPLQAVVLTITDRQAAWADAVRARLAAAGLRVEADLRNEKIGFKIREHTLQRVPYLLVVGDRELESGTVAVRTREGQDLGSMTPEAFLEHIAAERVPASLRSAGAESP
ncbi:MAG: threonine--tRNA ligase [Gammaproteobacteria bacterium]|nr:MAG: threonine--tRNA ligase [Gammaproteobacteria bacterium]